MKRGQWKQRNSYHVHQARTHHFLKMQSDCIQYLHNNRSGPTISHSFIQPAQACSRSTFLLQVGSLLSLSAATVTCKLTFTKVQLFIPACSWWWNRSSHPDCCWCKLFPRILFLHVYFMRKFTFVFLYFDAILYDWVQVAQRLYLVLLQFVISY